jgi:flagellar biosynthesis protein
LNHKCRHIAGMPASKPSIAVAVDKSQAGPPRVVATGRGALAEAILAVAFEHGVKVRADADLAEMLAAVDVDSPIPLEAFAAVAEILAYLYQAQASWPAGDP